jgi:prepilin-type N-terminal cleavage/methylation domain-containing protein
MKQKDDKFFNQKGVTLVELMVVILLIVILSTIAIMNMSSSKIQFERQTVARELKVAFERARFDSVKRRADGNTDSPMASVVVAGNSFTLKTDINQNGTIETSEDRVNSSWNPGISIRNTSGAAALRKRNVALIIAANQIQRVEQHFLVCNGDCTTPSASNSNLVVVTATGTVNILSGGATSSDICHTERDARSDERKHSLIHANKLTFVSYDYGYSICK